MYSFISREFRHDFCHVTHAPCQGDARRRRQRAAAATTSQSIELRGSIRHLPPDPLGLSYDLPTRRALSDSIVLQRDSYAESPPLVRHSPSNRYELATGDSTQIRFLDAISDHEADDDGPEIIQTTV